MSELESGVKLRAAEQERKAAGDMRQLQKDCNAVRKDKEDLSRLGIIQLGSPQKFCTLATSSNPSRIDLS